MLSAVLPYSLRQCHWPFYKSLYTLKSETLYIVKMKLFGQVLTAVILKQCFGSDQKYDFISFWVSTRSHMILIDGEEGWEQKSKNHFQLLSQWISHCKRKQQRSLIYPRCLQYGRWLPIFCLKKGENHVSHIYYQRWGPELQDLEMRLHSDFLIFSVKNNLKKNYLCTECYFYCFKSQKLNHQQVCERPRWS